MYRDDAEEMVRNFALFGFIATCDQTILEDEPEDRPEEQWSVTVQWDYTIIATVAGLPRTYEWSPAWGQAVHAAYPIQVVVAYFKSRGLKPFMINEVSFWDDS
jgi:hypothetical protein